MADGLSDQEVQELIRIADAGIKDRKGYWYTLGIPINLRYSLDEQLEAIRQLGKAGSPKALDYIRQLLHEERTDLMVDSQTYGGDCWSEAYPNAKGTLRRVLDHYDHGGLVSGVPEPHPRHEEARRVLGEALSQLEESLKTTS